MTRTVVLPLLVSPYARFLRQTAADSPRRAAMIDELSQEAQYICTTFRAELIPHADAYFGVVFNQAKISNVKTRALALFPSCWTASDVVLFE